MLARFGRFAVFATIVGVLYGTGVARAQEDDIADVPAEDLRAGGDKHARYFLIGPQKPAPKDGFGLVIVMPGGSGDADFHPFVKRIYKHAIPEGYLVAQPIAVQWTDGQEVIWPTEKNKVEKMKFSTEKFVAAVIKDVKGRAKIDAKKVFTLSWSSSGPAAYSIALANKDVVGSFVAMSVYRPEMLGDLKQAKGRAFYLYHSPDDRVCPYRMAEQAEKELDMHGAKVKLTSYEGGHSWRGDVYGEIRAGVEWLEENAAKRDEKKVR